MKTDKDLSRQLQFKMLSAALEIMASVGVSESSMREAFERAMIRCRTLRSRNQGYWQDGSYLPNGDISADLLRLWHRDSRCIGDDDAMPLALHVYKGRTSVRSLVRSLDPKANVSSVLSFLRSNGLVRRLSDGRYKPTADAATISRSDPVVGEHLARSVVRLLNTVRRNTAVNRGNPPLIERYAYVSNLDRNAINGFAEFTKSQGLAYLKAVDDWMEQRRVPRLTNSSKAKRGVVAGVQVIAYLGDGVDRSTIPASKRSRGTDGTD
jgi:hypothetical protein